jgi:glutaminase
VDNKTDFKGMTERDLLVVLNERVYQMKIQFDENNQKVAELEKDFMIFKTEIQTKLRIYTAIATTIATTLVSIIQHFLK